MSKLKLSLVFFIGTFLVLTGFTQRHALACEFIEYSNYSEIAPNIFVSDSFNLNQKNKLLSENTQDKSRVNNTFGQMISNPKVIITTNESEAADFGSNAYGNALLTPLGQCIDLGQKVKMLMLLLTSIHTQKCIIGLVG